MDSGPPAAGLDSAAVTRAKTHPWHRMDCGPPAAGRTEPKVTGSNPPPATNQTPCPARGFGVFGGACEDPERRLWCACGARPTDSTVAGSRARSAGPSRIGCPVMLGAPSGVEIPDIHSGEMTVSPQTLSVADRRTVASWAADCAERVLVIYANAVPDDGRVRAAIDQARAFASGELDVGHAVRRRGGEAGDAARGAPTPAARAAAYAAEQAAAVAHMGAHALGAAGYAAKASTLAAGVDNDRVTRAEASRHVAAMTADVARALSALSPIGENRSGPLAPGRLSGGHVGSAIREMQAQLFDRRSR